MTVKFHVLDISDGESIGAFGEMLKREHPEGIDAVVNNAGELFFFFFLRGWFCLSGLELGNSDMEDETRQAKENC